jgi:hypothetical protein
MKKEISTAVNLSKLERSLLKQDPSFHLDVYTTPRESL